MLRSIAVFAFSCGFAVCAGTSTAQDAPPAEIPASDTSPNPAAAAPEPPDNGPAAGNALEEIIVTARKRQESILKVPVAETALSEKQLQIFASSNLETVATQVPNLLFGTGTGAFGSQVSLRGVGTSVQNASNDQSVSLNLDGLQVSQGLAYRAGMFDMAQIEVLRGPQALFYGKSSPGGVISVHSADPTDEFEVSAQGGYEFEAVQKNAQLVVSGPVADTLKARLAASYSAQDGFFKNEANGDAQYGSVTPDHRFAPEQDYLVRGTLLWNPDEHFDAKLKANYTQSNVQGNGGDLQYASCPGGVGSQASPTTGIPFSDPDENCKGDRILRVVAMLPAAFPGIRNDGVPFSDTLQSYGTLEMNYHFRPDLTLTSVTGLYALHQNMMINGNASELAGPTLVSDNSFFRHDTTEELRLTSDFSGPVNFMLGGFIQESGLHNQINLRGNTFYMLPADLQSGFHKVGIRSASAFGQLLWKVIPTLELAGGARWTREQRTDLQIDSTSGTPAATPLAVPAFASYHINPEVAATYTPTDHFTFFASYREASKSGSYDTTTIVASGFDNAYRDEGARGIEGGIKMVALDRSLHVNLTGYHYHYNRLQVGTNVITSSGGIEDRTLNAASSKVYGFELESTYRVPMLRGLSVNANAAWNQAKFQAFGNAPCWAGQTIAAGCNQQYDAATDQYTAQNLSGRPMLRAPVWSTTFGFTYDTQLGRNLLMSFGSTTNYSSGYYTDLIERGDTIQHSYFKTDASLSISDNERRWEFAVIGHDLNNTITAGECLHGPFTNGVIYGSAPSGTTQNNGAQDDVACIFEPGREVWLRLTIKPYELWKNR